MTKECDEYCANYGCNQGRNCPARKKEFQRDDACTLACVVFVVLLASIGYIAFAWMLGIL